MTLAKAREDLRQHGVAPMPDPRQQRSFVRDLPFGVQVPALRVADLGVSVEFYKRLGFRDVYGPSSDPFRLLTGAGGMLALYDRPRDDNLICFTGGDLADVRARVQRGELHVEHPTGDATQSNYLLFRDPDGRAILLLSQELRTP